MKHSRDSSKNFSGRHERSANSYDRPKGKRSPSQCTLIVCEGSETEPNYFQGLRNYLKVSPSILKIVPRAGAPISIIEEAQKQVELRKQEIRNGKSNVSEIEAVWCVFDTENLNNNPSFNQAVQAADARRYFLAISNPAFEYWYVLHFGSTTRPFQNGTEVKEYLQQHCIHDYQESMDVFPILIDSTIDAIRRAKNALENHPEGQKRFPNPSTRVFLLVEDIINMSPSGGVHLK